MSKKQKKIPSKDKPFVEMNPTEFRRSWDSIGHDLDVCMLADARKMSPDEPMKIVAILLCSEGKKRVFTYRAEYGDDDAINSSAQEITRLQRKGMLAPGETLERVTFQVSLGAVQVTLLPLSAEEIVSGLDTDE